MCLRKYADYIANINGIARRNHYPINGSVTVLLHIGTRANKMAVELNQNDQWVGNKFTVADPNAAPPLALSWTDDDKTGESYWLR